MPEKASITEKEWESEGFKCKVIFARQSHRCGYVGVPKGHIAYDKDYDELPIDVHGGLTYGSIEGTVCWFRFDCAHLGDKMAEMPELSSKDHFWSLEETIKETEQMAKQFKKLTLRNIIQYKLKYMPDWFKDNIEIKIPH